MNTFQLCSGETISIKIDEPPLDGYGQSLCWWSDVASDLMAGKLREWLYTPYFVAEIDGELAGYMSCQTPADCQEIGLVEFVWTEERHRRKGIASILLGRLITDFTHSGGLALYLCTTNPHAGLLYEQHGFQYFTGDGMRYLAPDAIDFDWTYLEHCGTATVREATYSDLPRASVLYNHPKPSWIVKDYLTHCFRDTRFESHYIKTLKRLEEGRGFSIALENPKGRVVGMATVERISSFYEQHVGTLSFRVVPCYFSQWSDLVREVVVWCKSLEIGVINTHVADCDVDQKGLLEAAGFVEQARHTAQLRIDASLVDLVIYSLVVSEKTRQLFAQGDYYGGRHRWHFERSLEG